MVIYQRLCTKMALDSPQRSCWVLCVRSHPGGVLLMPRCVHLFAGTYIDHKCPFTGNVAIRGRILSGKVKSTKMNRTIVVRRDYLHYIKKYQR